MQKVLCSLVLLFSFTFAAGNVESVTLAKSDKSWDGSNLPAYPKEAPEISVLKITIPAHTELPLHKHPIINAGYMVKGSLKVVTDENKTLHLKAGDALIEVVDKWHYGVNEGDEPVEIVVFYAGTKASAYSIKK
ncbi:cupin domain-containing protein [Sulfurospirillum oryzae]|uniref:cupin domain-containing protein n=1 Tax=Sulfurospirillum oryzae TaxID=2976535 RepID=UPI0021E8C7AC|nr:cupin domain-containing protein [Sulfurospirillum oryzae]